LTLRCAVSEFLMTTLPVAPISQAATHSIVLPHFADGGGWQTHVLLVNPPDTGTATGSVRFDVLDLEGQPVASSTPVTLNAAGRISLFIDEIPGLVGLPPAFRGVLKLTADLPVSVMGIRSQYNERGELVISTTPAFLETSSTSAIDLILPHLASGQGYTTEFLVLSGASRTTGTVDFLSNTGNAMTLPIQR
jgi:hypothetical protein